jgi:hypothetical protein
VTEADIQRAVLAHIAARGVPGVFAMHYPAGGYRRPVEARILQSLGARAGVPDLLLVQHGKLFCLELKAPGGRASPAQLKTIAQLEYCGAKCAIAVGIDAALRVLTEWGLLRPDRNQSQGELSK